MIRTLRGVLVLVPLLVALTTFAPPASRALPLWARKYNMPCTSCHLAFPRLNDFGMKFRQRGYVMEGAEGETPWAGGVIPLSVVANVGVDVQSTNHYDPVGGWTRSTLMMFQQNQVELHSAGTLAKNISFHVDNNFAGVAQPLLSGMAFVQFDNIAKDGALNLKVGIFDAEIPYLSSSRRTTWADYQTPVTLDGRGLELNGEKNGWTYAAGLINSQRDIASVQARSPDVQSLNVLENPYVWLMRDVGPHRVTARLVLDRQNPRTQGDAVSNHVQMDLSALLVSDRFWLIPDYTLERFDSPDSGLAATVHHGMLEAVVLLDPQSRWLLTGRYELSHNPRRDPLALTFTPEKDASLAALDLSCYVSPNAKVALDWSRTWDNIRGDRLDELQALVHVGY